MTSLNDGARRPSTAVITGGASGIGRATIALLQSRGWRTIGIDLRGADIMADLSHAEGRARAVAAVGASTPDGLDAVIACAGISTRDEPKVVAVNFFGATRILVALRHLLARSSAPRAVVVASFAAVLPVDKPIVEACLADDEPTALAAATAAIARAAGSPVVYSSSKLALAKWVRRMAVSPEWAGSGILLNAIAPGTVETPMMQAILADPEKMALHRRLVPCPLDRVARPEEIAHTLAFFASRENSFITGQTVFIDGGSEALLRPDSG